MAASPSSSNRSRVAFWDFRSIDTMKHSRDLAREKQGSPSYDAVIEKEVAAIAESGATHVAIGTPYDEEFVPYLSRWVEAARRHGLKVWFRGNFSGWEGWFDVPRIDRETHLQNLRRFLNTHPSLFEDGDVFTSCPECENGGPGDPRQTGDVEGFRNFLLAENDVAQEFFRTTGKNVRTAWFSMNADVARLIFDPETTRRLDNTVTIDHYVRSPEALARDAEALSQKSGGSVVLGEFGAPIPDIHGKMTEAAQAEWLRAALTALQNTPSIAGLNYWTHAGSSTALWDDSGKPRQAASVLRAFYRPILLRGSVRDEWGRGIPSARVFWRTSFETTTDTAGNFSLLLPREEGSESRLTISAEKFAPKTVPISEEVIRVSLQSTDSSWFTPLLVWLQSLGK